MTRLVFRPIDQWPGPLTNPHKRQRADWTDAWSTITRYLDRELAHLGVEEIVVQIACDERAMRIDGGLRAGANPTHPGVMVAFESKHGPLRYHVDQYDTWKANLRAISLTLTALRAIDRYGATAQGEQYTGWKAIGSGIAMGPAPKVSVEQAARMLDLKGKPPYDPEIVKERYRVMARYNHPDAGGLPEVFRRITEARDVLLGASRG